MTAESRASPHHAYGACRASPAELYQRATGIEPVIFAIRPSDELQPVSFD